MPSSDPDFNLVWETEKQKVTTSWIPQTLLAHFPNNGGRTEPHLQPFKEATGAFEQEKWLN